MSQICSKTFAAERARLMFGCYRRTEAADAATYVGAVALVLTHYPAAVVEAITDPFKGLPSHKNENGYSGLPDVADVKQACEDEATRIERMAKYKEMGKTEFPRLPFFRETTPGAWARILVLPDYPRYAELMARTKDKSQDVRDWKIDEFGLHVSLAWIDGPEAARKPLFQQYTAGDLRRMYPPRDPPKSDGPDDQQPKGAAVNG